MQRSRVLPRHVRLHRKHLLRFDLRRGSSLRRFVTALHSAACQRANMFHRIPVPFAGVRRRDLRGHRRRSVAHRHLQCYSSITEVDGTRIHHQRTRNPDALPRLWGSWAAGAKQRRGPERGQSSLARAYRRSRKLVYLACKVVGAGCRTRLGGALCCPAALQFVASYHHEQGDPTRAPFSSTDKFTE